MTAKKTPSRRKVFHDQVDPGEDLDRTPVEIPVSARNTGKALEQQIQEQIALQIAKKMQPPG